MLQRSYKDEPAWGGETTFTDKMNVYIPLKLQLVCNKIARQVSGNEFSIFCKIEKIDGNNVYLSDFYTIPEQQVSSASIDYGKDPDMEVDTVIHRHPDGMNRFSGTDDAYINKNFKCSLLYTKSGGFVHGIYNMDMGNDTKLRLDVNPIVDDGLGDIDISNIKFKTYSNYGKGTYEYGYPIYNSRIREYGKDGEEITPHTVSRGSMFEMSDEEDDTKVENISTMDKLKAKWAKEEAEEKKKHVTSRMTGEELEEKSLSDKKAFEAFKKDYNDEIFDIKNELIVNNFKDAEVNDERLLELLVYLKEKIDLLESFYDDSFAGISEEMKLLNDRVDEIDETLDGIEFIEDDDEEKKGEWNENTIDNEEIVP